MNIDELTIDELRKYLKRAMVQLKETIETPTHIYKEGDWYFFIDNQDETIFLYLDDPHEGVELTYAEADKYLIF
jgi:hypothetical protein